MALQRAREHLAQYGLDQHIRELTESSATVALAAAALGTQPERIAKTLSFLGERPLLVVAAGDARVNGGAFKRTFGFKPTLIPANQVEDLIGHDVGGVCPFGVRPGVAIYLDESLRRFETVFPACGSGNSAIELTIDQLERASEATGWVAVCTVPDPAPQG